MTKRILIVDDEMGARVLISTFLDRGGFEVVKAKNGKEALDMILAGTAPDMVIMDIQMPEMDGITLTQAIRAKYSPATLPIIVLSGSGDVETVNRAMQAGATDFLSKPIMHHDLVAKVKSVLKITD